MRTTLNIADEVLAVARVLAEQTGKSLGEAVSELARRGLGLTPRPKNDELEIVETNGIPHFRVPADTPPITDEDVRKALDDWP